MFSRPQSEAAQKFEHVVGKVFAAAFLRRAQILCRRRDRLLQLLQDELLFWSIRLANWQLGGKETDHSTLVTS